MYLDAGFLFFIAPMDNASSSTIQPSATPSLL